MGDLLEEKPTIKALTAAFIVSVALNIGLLSSLVYIAVSDKEQLVMHEEPMPQVATRGELSDAVKKEVARLLAASFRELLPQLENTEVIADGIRVRDVALSCLVCFHNFHIEKAVGGLPFEVRNYSFTNPDGEEQIVITLFPEMTDETFETIVQFTRTEKWPLTPKGLFLELKEHEGSRSLEDAMYLTPECTRLRKVFERGGIRLNKQPFLRLLAEGSWDGILRIARKADSEEPTVVIRKTLAYLVKERSKAAAALLVEHESPFLLESARNEQLSAVIDLLEGTSEKMTFFLHSLAQGIRPQYVKEKAELKLREIAEKRQHPKTYQTVAPKAEQNAYTEVPALQKEYIVKPGDSLWKLSLKFKVSIKELRAKNNLEKTDVIRPGQKLMIPSSALEGTGSQA